MNHFLCFSSRINNFVLKLFSRIISISNRAYSSHPFLCIPKVHFKCHLSFFFKIDSCHLMNTYYVPSTWYIFTYFIFSCAAHRILVSRTGIEPTPKHWKHRVPTTGVPEVPKCHLSLSLPIGLHSICSLLQDLEYLCTFLSIVYSTPPHTHMC